MKNDSVFCQSCGQEFAMPLVKMSRRRHQWCEACVMKADRMLEEALGRATERLAGGGEEEGRGKSRKLL